MNRRVDAVIFFLLVFGVLATPTLHAQAQTIAPPDISIRIPGLTDVFTPAVQVDCPDEAHPDIESVGCIAFPWIGQYISAIYVFAVYAATILAAIVIMVAGFIWLTAGGNTNAIGSAKSYISGAIMGLALMLGSYTVLRLVNPDLVTFAALRIPIIKKVDLQKISENITGSAIPVLINCAQGQITTNISGQFDDMFNRHGATYGIDPFLLLAIAKTENSRFNPGLFNQQGLTAAFGLMQILPGTAKDIIARDSDLTAKAPASCQQPTKNPNYAGKGTPYWLYQSSCTTFLEQNPDVQVQMAASYLQYIRKVLAAKDPSAANDMALITGAYKQGEGNGVKMLQGLASDAVQADAHAYFARVNGYYRSFCPASTPPPPSSPQPSTLP